MTCSQSAVRTFCFCDIYLRRPIQEGRLGRLPVPDQAPRAQRTPGDAQQAQPGAGNQPRM